MQLILEVFVLHFVQEYRTLENSASQCYDEAIRRFVAARRNTHASSLLPAKLTHPLGQQQERGSSWCDPYSLTAKQARGWEGGAAEWWVEHQQRIEEAFTATALGGDISLSTVQHPFIHHYTIHPALHFHKDYIQTCHVCVVGNISSNNRCPGSLYRWLCQKWAIFERTLIFLNVTTFAKLSLVATQIFLLAPPWDVNGVIQILWDRLLKC